MKYLIIISTIITTEAVNQKDLIFDDKNFSTQQQNILWKAIFSEKQEGWDEG